MDRVRCPLGAACPLTLDDNRCWSYCGECGTSAHELRLPDEIDPAVLDEKGIYRMPLVGATASMEISAREVNSMVKFEGIEGFEERLFLRMDLSQVPTGNSAHILITSDDGRRESLWEPRAMRTRPVRLVPRAPKTHIAAIPGVAIFLGQLVQARFELANLGFTLAKIASPVLPEGYELVNPLDVCGFEIGPGERRAVAVRRKIGAKPAEIKFFTESEEEAVTVHLLPVSAPPPKTPPGLVVSIDFGTSNTSVFCLETRTNLVEPIGLMGDGKERRETVLYAPESVESRYWQAFPLGVMGKDVVRDLKTLVRERTPGSTERLEFYLRALLQNGIASFLAARNSGDERAVQFVFTVPVIDGADGPNHVHYRETLLSCARRAGFEDAQRGWSLRSMLEPDGGALEVISIPDISQKMTDGERMLILDVGGGTTDITLGRVRLIDRPHLDEIENVSILANEDQFGGEIATYVLGWRWAKASGEGVLPIGPDRARIGDENERLKTKNLVDYGWLADSARKAEAENWTVFDEVGHHPDQDNWERRFPDLWVQLRAAKHYLSNESALLSDQPSRVKPYEFNSRKPGPPALWKVGLPLLESALEKSVVDLSFGIEHFLRDREIALGEIHHVAMIGGSARLQPLRLAMNKMFPGRVLPLGNYVDVAVCRGASRLYQSAPPLLPVGFNLVVGDLTPIELVRTGASLLKVVRRTQPLEVPRGHHSEARIECVLPGGKIVPFLAIKFEDGFSGDISGSVSTGAVRLAAKPTSGEGIEYEVKLL